MEYSAALKFLDSFANYEKQKEVVYPEGFGLERIRRLVKDLGNPQNFYPNVIIAGSKGKGSTAAILSSILRMENYRVGLFTSPHLYDVRERICVNGMMIGEVHFSENMALIDKALDDPFWRKETPTYFEVLTALAFLYFKSLKVHVAVLEVGLGGLYDSTNVVEAKAVGITAISLEHTDKLGKTVAKIAVQKCGVIKGHEYVVSAPQVREVESVITDAAAQNDATLAWVGKDTRLTPREFDETMQKFDLKTPFGNFYGLTLPLLGEHQMENAAVAVTLAKSLEHKARLKVTEDAVKQGIVSVTWPGRMEKVSEKPFVVVDGAHNRDSVRRLLNALRRHCHFGRLITVLAVLEDKDTLGISQELGPETSVLFTTQTGHTRSMKAALIAEIAQPFVEDIRQQEDWKKALHLAIQEAGEADLVLVTGSLHLVAVVKKHMEGGF